MIAIGLSGNENEPVVLSTKNNFYCLTLDQAMFIAEQLDAVIEFIKKHENEDKP